MAAETKVEANFYDLPKGTGLPLGVGRRAPGHHRLTGDALGGPTSPARQADEHLVNGGAPDGHDRERSPPRADGPHTGRQANSQRLTGAALMRPTSPTRITGAAAADSDITIPVTGAPNDPNA